MTDRLIFLRVKSVSDKSHTKNQNVIFIFNDIFLENLAVFEGIWENVVKPDRPQLKIRRMHFACWITQAIDVN